MITPKMRKMNNLGYVVVDHHNNVLLFDPTSFYIYEDDTEVMIPFVLDGGRFTVFKDETALEEMYGYWGQTIKDMKYKAIPLMDFLGESLSEGIDIIEEM